MPLQYGAVVAREPRDIDSQGSYRKLGKRLAEWVAVFVGSRKDQHHLSPELFMAWRDSERATLHSATTDTQGPRAPSDISPF